MTRVGAAPLGAREAEEFRVDAPAHVERGEFVDAVGEHAHLRGEQREHAVANFGASMHDLAEHAGGIFATVASVTATIEAERGPPSIAASSPKNSPSPNVAQDRILAGNRLNLHAHFASRDEIQVRAPVVVIENASPACGAAPNALRVETLDRRPREGRRKAGFAQASRNFVSCSPGRYRLKTRRMRLTRKEDRFDGA